MSVQARGALRLAMLLVWVVGVAGCRSEAVDGSGGSPGSGGVPEPQVSIDDEVGAAANTADRCDPINPEYCMFPWPNDHFTVADDASDTGRRLNLQLASMPRNVLLKPLIPDEWNRNDGFSPGQLILARIPGVDLATTGAVPITDIADSYRADQPIVVIDADTLQRQLIWSELDANITHTTLCDLPDPVAVAADLVGAAPLGTLLTTVADTCNALGLPDNPLPDPGPALMIRPARNFQEGHRYIVALRRLKDADGNLIEASPAFRIFRDNHVSDIAAIDDRRAHMEALFATLSKAGIERADLNLAWDFTVASTRNNSARALQMRDVAFDQLGAAAPTYSVDAVTDFTPDENANIAREVSGSVAVPLFLNQPNGAAGSRLYYGLEVLGGNPDALPQVNPISGTMQADYTCRIPRAAYDSTDVATATAAVPARPALYGHGLLGSRDEVGAGNVGDMGQEHNFVFCSVDWIGMSSGDTVNVLTILLDMSNFPSLADRAQQGFLNFMFLGRAMIHADGFCSNAAFRVGDSCVIDRQQLYYDGNSQGGIMGGALVALSPDVRAGVLGVPGMNYSTLLRRSVDFDTYAAFMYSAYPASLDQSFVLSMIQMLWDRAEANGYVQHLRADDPLPNTPSKRVLLHPAFGDHQVSMWTAEVAARTIGAKIHCPAVVGGSSPQRGEKVLAGAHPQVEAEPEAVNIHRRHPDDEPYYGIDCMGETHDGSAIVVWDRGPTANLDGSPREDGVAPPPISNTPPRPDLGYGGDPHSDPRKDVNARVQKSEFLKPGGRVVNVCGAEPCATREFDPTP
ncbi:hypothetical protein E4T66_00280 [Sinimarinibacterium sp. CAU 1509]|uniref:hypothetical protein n=1 Tax=Sinimarinibacterium sp. CAU 1509 TaxID=2562283 RepID=UPI0010ACA318|nr:hypothetical protein [Sinimarinibacterium sp. CAU 1509]TJY64722.1 hypothetical protein E4T66_00280 [Sinimarinibacterium sp. CAU 1509]